MLDMWRTRVKKQLFYGRTRGILDTPVMPVVDAPWTIVSMVSNSDVQMYLLALKSFYSRIGRGKVTAIVDRNMPHDSRAALARHIPGIQLTHLEDINTGHCQHGGTWERLLYLLDHARDEYAIQLDCDTLTFGDDISDVISCAERNIPFTLGNAGLPIRPMNEWTESALTIKSDHICIASERVFDRYPGAEHLKYVRGSSGFCGFAKGAFPRDKIEAFHQTMIAMVGERWREWGTEQVGSNFAIANSPGAVVLPYPKYANFWPGVKKPNAFLHFIGSHRYHDGYFAKLARGVIQRLQQTQSTEEPAARLAR